MDKPTAISVAAETYKRLTALYHDKRQRYSQLKDMEGMAGERLSLISEMQGVVDSQRLLLDVLVEETTKPYSPDYLEQYIKQLKGLIENNTVKGGE